MPYQFNTKLYVVREFFKSFLAKQGFRSRSLSYVHPLRGKLIHAIRLRKELGQPTCASGGVSSEAQPCFTFDIGVFIPEVAEVCGLQSKFQQCEISPLSYSIRASIGSLTPGGEELLWPLTIDKKVLNEAASYLSSYAIPYLNRFDTRAKIRHEIASGLILPFPSTPVSIISAVLNAKIGNKDLAAQLIKKELNGGNLGVTRVNYFHKIAKRLSLTLSA